MSRKITIFAFKSYKVETMKDLNRLKVVLAEKKRTNKWLAEQLGKNVTTVSKWCTNTSQPDLQTLDKIASLLEIDVKDLLNSTRENIMYIPVGKSAGKTQSRLCTTTPSPDTKQSPLRPTLLERGSERQ